MPRQHDAEPFAEWIERLGTATDTPVFAPHITLVGAVPTTASRDAIGQALAAFPPFDVTFVNLADSDERFRCVTVVAAAETPLVEVRNALVATCGAEPTPYDPHLSLLYAELPSAERATLRDTVTLSLPRTAAVDRVCLVATTDEDPGAWSIEETWAFARNF